LIKGLRLTAIGAVVIGAAALAGCGSSSSGDESSGGSANGGAGATISSTDNSGLGKTILVDSSGRTLYMFEKDEADESYCNGACAKVWPAVVTKGTPKATKGVDFSKLTTLNRDDGTTQVVYHDHPLYTYEDDHKPGQTEGNGSKEFGAEWYAVEPNGDAAEPKGESGAKSGSDEKSGSGQSSSDSS
jgi:predicted lipoprotein with Yx(FWY)xxD motif